ncbi:MAG: isochorismatase family protein [Oscillospiraceae bacterium]|jgi:nicotinamidase-related amidase|nr:isochorismatase family protein [Oscillospiraceae bacterium]
MRNYPETLLDPSKSVVVIIDHQPQMYFGAESASRAAILNSAAGLAAAAKAFNVPCILTTIEAETFSGNMASKLTDIQVQTIPIDRTNINAWEDQTLKKAVTDTGRTHIILAGLWTEACVTFPALTMSEDGLTVYVAADACGGASETAHDMAILRMTQAGVIPMTWQQIMLEWQRDWNNKETYNRVMSIVKQYGGAYGLGVEYSEQFIPQN